MYSLLLYADCYVPRGSAAGPLGVESVVCIIQTVLLMHVLEGYCPGGVAACKQCVAVLCWQ
jgi:hypothetical protein